MARSKCITTMLAAFCGLAVQFQASGAAAQSTILYPGDSLRFGTINMMVSGNFHSLIMQRDGNLVLYSPTNGAIWSTNTFWGPDTHVDMQLDGNLVVYNNYGPVWASQTSGHPFSCLALQDDGNLVIYIDCGQYPGNAVWSSGTYGQ
jgi:hypothetical protein